MMRNGILVVLLAAAAAGVWYFSSDTTLVSLSEGGLGGAPALLTLTERAIALPDGAQERFLLAEGFELLIAAEGLGKARFITESPDGRLFVPDMVDYQLSHEGSVIILDNFNEDSGRFETTHTYLSDLRGPHNVAFYTDASGRSWLYLTLTEHLLRYPYQTGDTEPSGEREVVYTFPNEQSAGADGVVWHISRTAHFVGDTLYVSVGSGCNACEENPEEDRAVILAMNPDGSNAQVYAEGIKNAVGLLWHDGALYATENGVDHLGTEAPQDLLYRVEERAHYGWPYCYEQDGEKVFDNTFNWTREPVECAQVPLAFAAFDPHSAPLGLAYFGANSPAALRESFLVALQGSFRPVIGNGYELVRVLTDGTPELFLQGFVGEGASRFLQPVDILQRDEHSFFFTDDLGGRLYLVREEQ
jgi:glucose/arabinose dehydrogenase